jgi:hypothetical protein
MTDKQLKNNLKKLRNIIIIIIIFIIFFVAKIFYSKKTELSICANVNDYNLESFGINQDEFEKYLSIFGNLIDEKYNEKQRKLNMAINFIENMYSSYEVIIDDNGLKIYNSDIVNKIISDVTGSYIEENFADGQNYLYNKEEKYYKQNMPINRIPHFIKIDNISKENDKINVIYTVGFFTNEEFASYMIGEGIKFEKYKVQAIIMENKDYEYSKYFVNDIKIKL